MNKDEDNKPKTPLEAAIDKATGHEPGDESRVVADAGQDGQEVSDTKRGEDAASTGKGRDWVKEAYECFVKNAVDQDPTDPAGAVWEYFKKNATDELKAKVEQEGKTAEGCWKFIEAVARKALRGRSGHIDPVTVYAIAMHYFQDVPKDWDKVEKPARREAASAKTGNGKRGKDVAFTKKVKDKGRKTSDKGKARTKKPDEKPKAKKGGKEQGFFFDLLETETASPAGEGGAAC